MNSKISIILILFLLYSTECYTKNEITIKIHGTGKQKILSDSFNRKSYPTSIKINDVVQDDIKNEYNLNELLNSIIFTWDSEITNLSEMFQKVENLTSVDFSKFDSSNVIETVSMFNGCNKLKKLIIYL